MLPPMGIGSKAEPLTFMSRMLLSELIPHLLEVSDL